MKVKVLGVQLCQLFATPWTVAPRLLCPWDSPGKNMSGGLPFPSPGDLPNPEISPGSPTLPGKLTSGWWGRNAHAKIGGNKIPRTKPPETHSPGSKLPTASCFGETVISKVGKDK